MNPELALPLRLALALALVFGLLPPRLSSSPTPLPVPGSCPLLPRAGTVQELAASSGVVIEGKIQEEIGGERLTPGAGGWNEAGELPGVRVRVHQVWPLKTGGLKRDRLVWIDAEGFGGCLKAGTRYIFFMEPTNSTDTFRTSHPPLETASSVKKGVSTILCEGCGEWSAESGEGLIFPSPNVTSSLHLIPSRRSINHLTSIALPLL